jgi:two-component system chemotaxis sensor kinase CheA
MSIDLSQFYQVFFDEAAEHLAAMESLLLGLDVSNPSMDDLNAIFRSAHSIKGGAGTFGFTDMTEVTHILETLLDKLRKQEMTLVNEMISAFLEAGDVISMQLAAHRGEGEVDAAAVSAVCEKLESLTSVQQGAPAHAATAAVQPVAPVVTASQTQEDPGYGFFDDEPEPAAQKSEATDPQPEDPSYGFFEDTPVQKAEKEAEQGYGFFQELAAPAAEKSASATPSADAPLGVQQDAVAAPAAAAPANTAKRAPEKAAASSSSETSSIRVSVEKVDQLINLVGELVITQAMLAQSAQDMLGAGGEHLQSGMYQLERNTRDLQEAVMSIRMMPISFVFSRFPRLVRDLAGKLNKQVELKLVGENTELDKGLIEKISDPLTHLVRNSLDHGIESVEKRIAAGKNACGTITLKAFHQGGNVVIEVADDGGGLNRGKILSKAKERGLPVRDEMTDQEVWALIMEPGFSTADVVTDVSGRGVGMDVVKRNIAEIGGRVELDSLEGMGSRVIIRLPLTLAILDGLSVLVGNETYIVPLGAIIESLQISESDLKTVSGEGRMLHVRGEYLPLVALHEVFNTKARAERLEQGIVVIVEAEGKKTALFVDDLLGQHQVVIKSLESNFRKIKGVSGATIMGDGKVALILDVAALVVHHGMRTGG